jgi:hypothetical protein
VEIIRFWIINQKNKFMIAGLVIIGQNIRKNTSMDIWRGIT